MISLILWIFWDSILVTLALVGLNTILKNQKKVISFGKSTNKSREKLKKSA